ncbi:MAG: hypothetical protein WCF90_10590 [Methanomicrobiales archaeon]
MATVEPSISGTGINGAVHLIIDITVRKRVEERFHQNQMQLITVMDLTVIMNLAYDFAADEFIFDDRFYSMYGTAAKREGGNRMPAEQCTRVLCVPMTSPRL